MSLMQSELNSMLFTYKIHGYPNEVGMKTLVSHSLPPGGASVLYCGEVSVL